MASAKPAEGRYDHERLLTTNEFAEFLSLRPGVVAKWRSSGRGPRFVRISSRAVRYRQVDIDRWLTRHVAGPEIGPQDEAR